MKVRWCGEAAIDFREITAVVRGAAIALVVKESREEGKSKKQQQWA